MKLIFSLVIILFFFSGCSEENGKINSDVQSSYENRTIPVVDEVWLQNKINNRNGKILFINFWATWCVPCVEEFPDLVKIYNEYKDSDFEFLSVSVDLPSEIETKVKPFLKEQSAEFQVVVAEEKRSDKIINLINPEWNGAVPLTVIYDAEGNRQEYIPETKEYESFRNSIERVKSL